jgi:hypothetical protein
MHPEMIRALAAEQTRDWQSTARAHSTARLARQARKALRRQQNTPDPMASVRVPDYVDGTFHGEARAASDTHTEVVR